MLFSVTVPNTAESGENMRIRCPRQNSSNSNIEVMVEIPKGLKPGDSFMFELPPERSSTELASKSTLKGSAVEGIRGKFEDFTRQHEEVIFAVWLGLVIGLSLIGGFMSGVLYSTNDFLDFEESLAFNNALQSQ